MAKCEQCGVEFEAKRMDARFCGSACRKAHSRVTDNSVTDNPPQSPDNVTDNVMPNKVTLKAIAEHQRGKLKDYKPQSFNPMMVGYVPPRGNEKVN